MMFLGLHVLRKGERKTKENSSFWLKKKKEKKRKCDGERGDFVIPTDPEKQLWKKKSNLGMDLERQSRRRE